jgi:signal transduction histidine kinase
VVGEEKIISGWLIVFRDLTEEIRLAQLREDLTRMLVHDLRSPMVTIQGGLDMIEIMIKGGENEKDELLEMLEISRRGGEQLLGMINELLSIHKFESGQLVLNLEPVILSELISEETLGFTSLIKQINIQTTTDHAPGLPVMVMDKDLIRRLIHNLLDNAIKFTGDGGSIETWAKPDPDDSQMVLFGVKDSGIGIPPEVQTKLFQKYFSSGDKTSRRKGTGIGLYFSKLAVEAHGGTIWVESEPGKGSNFIIRMPVEAQPPA